MSSDTTKATPTFRFEISPDEFIRRVDPDKLLRSIVESSTAIVAPRDITRLMGANPNSSDIKIMSMHMDQLTSIFHRITDGDGNQVYKGADIQTGRVSPSLVKHGQTFVQAEKIVGLGGLQKLFSHFDNSGVSKTPASIIVYEHGKERYVALYFPVVVEVMEKSLIEPIFENFKKRVEIDPQLRLPAFENGQSGIVDLARLVRETDALLTNKDIKTIYMLRDGTHRSHATNIAGTTMHALMINGSTALATGIPLNPREMVVTTRKPEKLEDRYLGFMPRAWLNYKELGIDG